MSKTEQHTNAGEKQDGGKRGIMWSVGGILLAIAGVYLVMRASRDQSGASDWLWYAGAGMALAGGMTWFLSGMPREQAIDWVKSALFAITLALLIRWPIAEPYRIPSSSMEPTLHGDPGFGKGDRVFVNKWIYGVRVPFMNKRLWYGKKPERWDIVVFKKVDPDGMHGTLVKRIVGMPGERIQIRPTTRAAKMQPARQLRDPFHYAKGEIFVTGKDGEERRLEMPDSMPEEQFYTCPRGDDGRMVYGIRPEDEFSVVPEGHYLVLGDNSDDSNDGRYFGWLPNEHIVGRVSCIWWPPGRWRDFTGFTQTVWWRATLALLAAGILLRLFVGRSWLVARTNGPGMDHFAVSFASLGLRVPMTTWWLTLWGKPKRGDLVLYRPQGEDLPKDAIFLGRVAGLPGEEVHLDGGKLHVNGAAIETPACFAEGVDDNKHPSAQFGISKNKAKRNVPQGHYYILNDPAYPDEPDAAPSDSRSAGWVPRERLTGKALGVWWPPTRWRKFQ